MRGSGLLLVVAVTAWSFSGCQRAIPDPALPPSPRTPELTPDAPPDEPDLEEVLAPGPLVGEAGLAPAPPPEIIDPILDSRWASHPDLEERIEFWIGFWTGRGAEHFQRYLERMHRYEEVVDAELERRALPTSLRYLPLVESGYNPLAVSRVGATGLWQLMRPTARYLDISVDGLLDERRDPVVSTAAAMDYLEELHELFGSWFLALAAYNAGPGRVGRAVRRHANAGPHHDGTYLELRRALPAETREFVPRFFAAARIARDPEGHGLTDLSVEPRLAFEVVSLPDATSLDVVAASAEVPEEVVEALNPQVVRGFTPAGRETEIRLPVGSAARFSRNYARLPPEERITFMEHAVARGETLTHVARRYGVPLSDLRAANGGVDPRRLQIGQRLVIPLRGRSPVLAAGSPAAPVVHRVNSGDTLSGIASRYGVSTRALAQENGLSLTDVIRPGEELTVPTGGF